MKNITKKELEKIYMENTNDEACKILGVSKVTLLKMIDDAGIRKKGKGFTQKYMIV